MSTSYKVGDLDEYFRNSQTERRELAFQNTNKFEEIYNLWMENPSFAKFDGKDDSFKSVFGKFFKKSKKKSQMASIGEDIVDESIMKSKKKNKKMKPVRMSTEGDADISNASELNDSVSEMQKPLQSKLSLSPTEGSGVSKRKRKFNSSQQVSLEISDDQKTESSPTKKKRQKKNKSQVDDSKADISNVAVDLADSVLDDSADVTFDGTSASNVSAISLASNGSLKKKKKKKPQQLGGASTPNQMNESMNNEEQMVIDGSPMKNKKKRKNKKKKLAQNGTTSILDGSNNSLDEQDESPNTKIEAEITDDAVNRKRKLSQGNISTDNFADDESIDDPLDDCEGATTIDGGSKKKKKGNKWLEAKNKSEIKSPILSKKEAKMLKKKNKKLKGIVSGLDTELELTKFSSKSDDVIDDENDMKDEDDGDDSAESDDDKGSFPRTTNKKFVPKEEESQERLDRTLFVGNLPTNVDQKILKDIFKGMGKVESVRLRCAVPPKPSMSQKVANIKHEYHEDATSLKGFVVFEEKEDAEKALTLNGTVFNGNHIRVDKAFGRRPRPDGKSPANNKGPQQQHDNKDTLFLGNLPYNVDDETLWNTFSNCGTIKNVRVIRDNGTGIGKGFGFVQFEDSSGIDQALALDGTNINGRPMRVKLSENKPRNEGPRKFQNQQNRSFGSGPQRKFGFNKFRGRDGGQESGPRKTFKKMNNKRKMEQEKKKVAGIFKTDKS